jgi:hypothetical protein
VVTLHLVSDFQALAGNVGRHRSEERWTRRPQGWPVSRLGTVLRCNGQSPHDERR